MRFRGGFRGFGVGFKGFKGFFRFKVHLLNL